MTDKPKKPFLDDGDLGGELDAWDATFDALHGESGGDTPPPTDVMAWPTPTREPSVPVRAPTPPPVLTAAEQTHTIDDFALPDADPDPELEAQMTLDQAISDHTSTSETRAAPPSGPMRRSSPFAANWEAPAGETDFSDVGGEGKPAALGQMLGPSGGIPADESDGEDVYTSASRPNVPQAPTELELDDDPIAPPPMPIAPQPARRTAAIIRRTPEAGVAALRPTMPPPFLGDPEDTGAFRDSTRIASFEELDDHAEASRDRSLDRSNDRSNDRSKAPTAPPPMSFASDLAEPVADPDDEYELEIGESHTPIPTERSPESPAPARRTVAHVVRRVEGMKSQPIALPIERVVAPAEAEAAPVRSGGEDDFSDVAAAVGASEEGAALLGDDLAIPMAAPADPIDSLLADEPELPRAPTPVPTDDALIDDHLATLARSSGGMDLSLSGAGQLTVAEPPSGLGSASIVEPNFDDDHEQTEDRGARAETRGPAAADDDTRDADIEVDDRARFANRPIQRGMATLEMSEDDHAGATVVLPDVAPMVDRPPALVDLYPRVKTPTSVPPFTGPSGDGAARRPFRAQTPLPVLPEDAQEIEATIDFDALQLPEQVDPIPSTDLDDDAADALLVYERELATIDDSAQAAALRVEAGRLCERLGDADRARSHYDAALLADPRAMSALRGLRRLARASSDLGEATRQLEAELAVCGALERRPLGHYRVDLLLASGEQDMARVAVGELLDSAPSDVRALLAQLELAFLDGRAEEFGTALEKLAHAVSDMELRASVQSARGVLSAHQNDSAGAMKWFAAAAESDPASLSARLGMLREHARNADPTGAAQALLELARQAAEPDPMTAAALALRAQTWANAEPRPTDADEMAARAELAQAAARVATDALPADPLVARLVAETWLAAVRAPQEPDANGEGGRDGGAAAAAAALAAWAATAAPPAERAYAAARAAELEPARDAELWTAALHHDPGDDYAAAQLRTSHVAAEQTQLAIEVDLAVAADVERDRARLRAAFGMIAANELEAAIDLLRRARAERHTSLALAEALAEALAASGHWGERATLLAELAAAPGEQLAQDVAQLRAALAWEEAVGAASEANQPDEVQRACAAALDAWGKVLERDASSPTAHAAAIALATRIDDRDVLGETLARAQEAERSPWAAASLALRRARLAGDDPARVTAMLREASPTLDDPRRTVALLLASARRGELEDAAAALEERAALLDKTSEAATLRLRAAQLALDAGDAVRATTLLVQVERALPQLGVVRDLLSAARRRSGDRDRSGPIVRIQEGATAQATSDAFAQLVRDGDHAAAQNDGAAALALYQRALEIRPGDPLAALPLVRTATMLREAAPLAALALAQLRAAESAGDGAAKANAYELLASIDKNLRGDPGSAQIALESASQADPTRVDLLHRLEREYTLADQIGELLRLRKAEIEHIGPEYLKDRAAMIMDASSLAERDRRPDGELAELYRGALAADPRRRLAMLHLESIVRRTGASADLAALEEQIAQFFEGDPRTQASFYTRSGETLAEIGQIDAAVQRFTKADSVLPGHVPALEAWRSAALKGQLWIDAADAATRQASVGGDPSARAKLHHFAGVVLMDKALAGEQAMQAFRRALDAESGHKDAFLRMRILLEEDGNHDELAILLVNRLAHETNADMRVEIHRAAAKLFRDFLGDRESAKQHYREILAHDPNDLRAHAAIADISWEQGAWQDAADALIARARLEHDAETLKTLCFRLGLIYADRLVDVPMALKAFQRALTYQPDDEGTLVRLADLATQVGEWKLALGACERLVKHEQDPDRRAAHLHRVARIFKNGFGDQKRAERALNLALDGAPTNDEALAELVRFYRESGDMTSVRVHLNRVAGTMRTRVAQDPKNGVAYRVIARAMAARAAAGVDGSLPIARSAAELAMLMGEAGDPERVLLADPPRVDLSALLRPESDDALFPRGVQPELRQLFTLLGDRVAKHVGVDLRAYGVGRGDRLRARDSAVAAHAQDIATGLGFGEIDVYVSQRQPYAMVAEPTSPVSLVIGQAIAQSPGEGGRTVRFAAGAALKLAQSSLAIPARLPADELGVLVVSLVRLFQPEFPGAGLDEGAIAGQMQKLRRLIPTGLMNELKAYGLAIDAGSFSARDLARDLRIAGLRAGLVASGSLLAGLSVLASQGDTDIPSFLADPVAQGLVSFALAEDHAAVAR